MFALHSRDDSNKKFGGHSPTFEDETVSNFVINETINGRRATIEAHIIDSGNDWTALREDTTLTAAHSLIDGKPDNEKLVIFYMPGLAEDIRTYQYIGRKNSRDNPMWKISQQTGLPVVTMNMPPFGKSQIEGHDRYDFDDNFKMAKIMVEKLAQLYKIPTQNIIPWSWCLGGNTAVRIAAEFQSKGVLLDAVPTSTDDISLPKPGIQQGLWALKPFILSQQAFDLTDTIKKLQQTQVLIRHRRDDTVINHRAADKFLNTNTLISVTEPERDPFKRSTGKTNIVEEIFSDPNFRYKTGHYLTKPEGDYFFRWLERIKHHPSAESAIYTHRNWRCKKAASERIPMSLQSVSDWGERARATPLHLQG